MATTTFNGVTVPAGTDLYNLAPDIKTAFESAGVIVEAADSTARDAIAVAALAAGGGTLARSLYVHRLDTNIVEATEDGSNWYQLRTPVHVQGSAVTNAFIKTGLTIVSTNASGDSSFTFTTAFPTGLINAIIMEATAPTTLGALIPKWRQAESNASTLAFRLYQDNGTVLASTAGINISFLAIGY